VIVFLKKSSIFLLSIIFLCSAIIASLAFGSICTPTSENASFGKLVIIDAGHGEPDGGAVGSDGTCEALLNLQVAEKLNNLLSQADIKTVMTRTTEQGIHSPDCKTIAQKKSSDMKKRREIQKNMGADIFCSIHMNQFSESKYYGAQVVYDNTNENAKLLARLKRDHSVVDQIEILPFKKLCTVKYERLSIPFPFADFAEPTDSDVSRIEKMIADALSENA
jgi:N-acetylmuramoyl-L-alanine amidase